MIEPLGGIGNSREITQIFIQNIGGKRYETWGPEERHKMHFLIWSFVKRDPARSFQEVKHHLSQNGIELSRTTIRRVFKEWRWSFKAVEYKQKNKFTVDNAKRYVTFIRFLCMIDHRKLKFMDEVRWLDIELTR
eukprot:TRINITY_DN2479_c0_g1_i3.p1 TRINITY_DN2479_c0_g1~~TRINITY_DN2479_c0_g1_i3.p1  ORF type:complete len:134 (-),score=11.93 TRINITY_DN2479_c0_g1_i3:489-890(-)